jgi:putative ABC transport system permease protein
LIAQKVAEKPGQYRKLFVSALTKPEDDFARRDPRTMKPDELERWSCSPYVSSIAYSIKQVLPGSDVRVIRRVADGEGKILTRVRTLLWLVTLASLLAAALAVGASSAASVIERRTEIGLMKALGAGSGTVGWLLAPTAPLAFVGVASATRLACCSRVSWNKIRSSCAIAARSRCNSGSRCGRDAPWQRCRSAAPLDSIPRPSARGK